MKGLALDGGGVFGVGQASIVDSVKNMSKFDFFAGTSIGSAICAYLASNPDKPSDLEGFFTEWVPKIFSGHSWRQWNVFSARYNDKELNKALQTLLPGQFGAVKKLLFVTAINLADRRLKVFNSTDPDDGSWPLWEVVRCAVAAETYFSPWKGFGDGGVIANNPAMVGISAASSVLHSLVTDVELCSIGTGSASGDFSDCPTGSWNRLQWGAWLLSALLSGSANTMHAYFAASLPLKKYVRIDFQRKSGWEMDNPDDMLKALDYWEPQIVQGRQIVSQF